MKLDCAFADVCLPDYWSGHHLPYIQVPVYRGMTLAELKRELKSELNNGYVANEPHSKGTYRASDSWYRAANAAIGRITANSNTLFNDLEDDEDGDSVYAYFVFQKV
jgi:hypothetical protein